MKKIKIKNQYISDNHKPFLIAEISANHKNSLSRIYKLIREAAKAGFSAIKIQTYKANTITMDINKSEFKISDKKSIWNKQSLFNLYKKGSLPWEWHIKISNYCKKFGIIFFSTPFDESAVDLLEKLKVHLYKISSFEITHYPLIKKIAETKKPVILSTGMAKLSEIKHAINILNINGCSKIVVLKCTSTYPAESSDSNLKTIPDMKKKLNLNIGLSDHTIGFASAITAISLGANVIEKHVTIERNDKALDSKFSLEIKDFKKFVKECLNAKKSLGKVFYGATKNEISSLKYRRSIYVSSVIEKGEKITKKNIKVIRPAYGLNPKYYEKIIGKISKIKLNVGDKINLKNLK